MDDFLHNLRSGKLKQPDRGRRDYADYKGPQRRAGSDRRRTDYYAKVTAENFALVKDSLDLLAEQQKRIADALVARKAIEARIASALEAIAARFGHRVSGPDAATGQPDELETAQADESAPAGDNEAFSGDKLVDEDRPRLLDMIASMRETGQSWEKIARQLVEDGVPTVSGKGLWRGPAVKKFWDANAGGLDQ